MKLLKDVLNANIILITMIKFKKRKSSAQLRISVSLSKREEIKDSCAIIYNSYFEKLLLKYKQMRIQANENTSN